MIAHLLNRVPSAVAILVLSAGGHAAKDAQAARATRPR